MAKPSTTPLPTVFRPLLKGVVDSMNQKALRKHCIAACKSEGLMSTWVQTNSNKVKRDFLTSPKGSLPSCSTTVGHTVASSTPIAPTTVSTHPVPTMKITGLPSSAPSEGVTLDEVKDLIRTYSPKGTTPVTPSVSKGDIESMVTELLSQLAEPTKKAVISKAKRKAITSTTPRGLSPAEQAVYKYCSPDNIERNVLLKGPAGSGKTYLSRAFGETAGFDLFVEYDGKGTDGEAAEMLGYTEGMSNEDGNMTFTWCDGKVTQAFRAASEGKTVCLLIDEIFRISKRERDALLSALAPYNGEYRLQSGRTLTVEDGIAVKETISAPVANLAIIATTNVGSAFMLEELCYAEKERWFPQYCPTDWVATKRILKDIAIDLGWERTSANYVSGQLVNLGKATVKMEASAELDLSASLRTLSRALSSSYTKVNDLESLRGSLYDEVPIWVVDNDDGSPNQAQIDKARLAIDELVK